MPHASSSSRRRSPALLLAFTLAVAGCADASADIAALGGSEVVDGEPALFDADVVHTVTVEFDDADYEQMIEDYATDGEKTWIVATVTIDGVRHENVGLRLKGNSSLAGLRSGTGDGGRGGGPSGQADADAPADLPWLIRLDKFVDGATHQGYQDLVIRSNGTETSLNEALALELLAEAGLASQEAIAVAFTVGDETSLRLAIEHPDDVWMAENFDAADALYKAESTGDYSYRGDDPDAYDEVFDQEAGEDNVDLTPLIDFLAFVDAATDEEFAAGLAERFDVDAFATYLAMMEVLDNFDDIDGPGNNSYLHWDADTGVFTVVPWDMNLAFGQVAGGGGGGGLGPPDGVERPEGFEPPAGIELPDGIELPEGFEPSAGFERPAGGGGPGGGPGGLGGTNPLVERFLAVDAWADLVEARVDELRASLVDSGVAAVALAGWADVVTASGLVDAAVVAAEVAALEGSLDGPAE